MKLMNDLEHYQNSHGKLSKSDFQRGPELGLESFLFKNVISNDGGRHPKKLKTFKKSSIAHLVLIPRTSSSAKCSPI